MDGLQMMVTRFPPDLAALTIEQWRFRWGMSRRQLAEVLGLTEAKIKVLDPCLLSNPWAERSLYGLNHELTWRLAGLPDSLHSDRPTIESVTRETLRHWRQFGTPIE